MNKAIDLKTYAEVFNVLEQLGEEYINRLPEKMYKLICKKNKLYNNDVHELGKTAIDFIAVLHYKYWTNSDEERQELKSIFIENEEKNKKELEKKYTINPNIFISNHIEKINKVEIKEKKCNLIIIQDNKWYIKIFNKIRNWFNKWGKNGK